MRKGKVKLFKHQMLITSVSVFAIVVSMIGGSYALFTDKGSGEYNVITVGDLDISYVDRGDGYGDVLSLNGSYPMSDSDGANQTPYRFSVENRSGVAIDYKIKILNDESIVATDGCSGNLLDPKYIKYKLDNGPVTLLSTKESDGYTIFTETGLVGQSSDIHEIRIWITNTVSNDNLNNVLGKHFHGKVVVETNQTGVDELLKREYPVGNKVILKDGSKWHVLKASSSSSSTVTLLSDYNLKVDAGHEGEYNETCGTGLTQNTTVCSPIVFDSSNRRDGTYCSKSVNGCNIYSKNNSTILEDSEIKLWLEENYAPKLKASLLAAKQTEGNSSKITLENLTVSLPMMEEIAKADNKTFNQAILSSNISKSFLKSTNYWTKTASSSNTSYVWYIAGNTSKNAVEYANNTTTVGIRPVITTSKLNVESSTVE